jgi:GPI mannosyltransferase 3
VTCFKGLARTLREISVSKHDILVLILCLAWIVRLLTVYTFPSLHHPDENFQSLEQAHRLAFGYGISTWEFEDGIRSLVLPYVFSAVFRASALITDEPESYILLSRLLLILASLLPIALLVKAAETISRSHALIVGVVAATWFELVYYSFRPLSEAVAADFLISALALGSCADQKLTARRCFSIGALATTALMIRIQFAPAVVVLLVGTAKLQFRERWLFAALGAIPPLIFFGVSDWISWGYPYYSYVRSLQINLFEGKASTFGTQPWYWYLKRYSEIWAGAAPIILFLVFMRARAFRLWIAVALAILISHSIIPHKESRFVLPASICLVLVAAFASADFANWIERRVGKFGSNRLPVAIAFLWAAVSAALAISPGYSYLWFKNRNLISASFWLARQPDLCGLLVRDFSWGQTGGYTYLHRRIPIYDDDARPSNETQMAYNYILSPVADLQTRSGSFVPVECFGDDANAACLIKRAGGCTPVANFRSLLEQPRLGENPPSAGVSIPERKDVTDVSKFGQALHNPALATRLFENSP